jgi:hypothetical protein
MPTAVLIIILVSAALFLGLMVPTFLISVMPKTTIGLLEAFRFYAKGTLHNDKRDYVDGRGGYVNRRCYISIKNNKENFEDGHVFLNLLFVFMPFFLLLGIIAYFVLSKYTVA